MRHLYVFDSINLLPINSIEPAMLFTPRGQEMDCKDDLLFNLGIEVNGVSLDNLCKFSGIQDVDLAKYSLSQLAPKGYFTAAACSHDNTETPCLNLHQNRSPCYKEIALDSPKNLLAYPNDVLFLTPTPSLSNLSLFGSAHYTASLQESTSRALMKIASARKEGITQADLAYSLDIDAKTIFYHVKILEILHLALKIPLIRNKKTSNSTGIIFLAQTFVRYKSEIFASLGISIDGTIAEAISQTSGFSATTHASLCESFKAAIKDLNYVVASDIQTHVLKVDKRKFGALKARLLDLDEIEQFYAMVDGRKRLCIRLKSSSDESKNIQEHLSLSGLADTKTESEPNAEISSTSENPLQPQSSLTVFTQQQQLQISSLEPLSTPHKAPYRYQSMFRQILSLICDQPDDGLGVPEIYNRLGINKKVLHSTTRTLVDLYGVQIRLVNKAKSNTFVFYLKPNNKNRATIENEKKRSLIDTDMFRSPQHFETRFSPKEEERMDLQSQLVSAPDSNLVWDQRSPQQKTQGACRIASMGKHNNNSKEGDMRSEKSSANHLPKLTFNPSRCTNCDFSWKMRQDGQATCANCDTQFDLSQGCFYSCIRCCEGAIYCAACADINAHAIDAHLLLFNAPRGIYTNTLKPSDKKSISYSITVQSRERMNFILDYLHTNLFIESSDLYKTLTSREKQIKAKERTDKRTIARLLEYLVAHGYIQCYIIKDPNSFYYLTNTTFYLSNAICLHHAIVTTTLHAANELFLLPKKQNKPEIIEVDEVSRVHPADDSVDEDHNALLALYPPNPSLAIKQDPVSIQSSQPTISENELKTSLAHESSSPKDSSHMEEIMNNQSLTTDILRNEASSISHASPHEVKKNILLGKKQEKTIWFRSSKFVRARYLHLYLLALKDSQDKKTGFKGAAAAATNTNGLVANSQHEILISNAPQTLLDQNKPPSSTLTASDIVFNMPLSIYADVMGTRDFNSNLLQILESEKDSVTLLKDLDFKTLLKPLLKGKDYLKKLHTTLEILQGLRLLHIQDYEDKRKVATFNVVLHPSAQFNILGQDHASANSRPADSDFLVISYTPRSRLRTFSLQTIEQVDGFWASLRLACIQSIGAATRKFSQELKEHKLKSKARDEDEGLLYSPNAQNNQASSYKHGKMNLFLDMVDSSAVNRYFKALLNLSIWELPTSLGLQYRRNWADSVSISLINDKESDQFGNIGDDDDDVNDHDVTNDFDNQKLGTALRSRYSSDMALALSEAESPLSTLLYYAKRPMGSIYPTDPRHPLSHTKPLLRLSSATRIKGPLRPGKRIMSLSTLAKSSAISSFINKKPLVNTSPDDVFFANYLHNDPLPDRSYHSFAQNPINFKVDMDFIGEKKFKLTRTFKNNPHFYKAIGSKLTFKEISKEDQEILKDVITICCFKGYKSLPFFLVRYFNERGDLYKMFADESLEMQYQYQTQIYTKSSLKACVDKFISDEFTDYLTHITVQALLLAKIDPQSSFRFHLSDQKDPMTAVKSLLCELRTHELTLEKKNHIFRLPLQILFEKHCVYVLFTKERNSQQIFTFPLPESHLTMADYLKLRNQKHHDLLSQEIDDFISSSCSKNLSIEPVFQEQRHLHHAAAAVLQDFDRLSSSSSKNPNAIITPSLLRAIYPMRDLPENLRQFLLLNFCTSILLSDHAIEIDAYGLRLFEIARSSFVNIYRFLGKKQLLTQKKVCKTDPKLRRSFLGCKFSTNYLNTLLSCMYKESFFKDLMSFYSQYKTCNSLTSPTVTIGGGLSAVGETMAILELGVTGLLQLRCELKHADRLILCEELQENDSQQHDFGAVPTCTPIKRKLAGRISATMPQKDKFAPTKVPRLDFKTGPNQYVGHASQDQGSYGDDGNDAREEDEDDEEKDRGEEEDNVEEEDSLFKGQRDFYKKIGLSQLKGEKEVSFADCLSLFGFCVAKEESSDMEHLNHISKTSATTAADDLLDRFEMHCEQTPHFVRIAKPDEKLSLMAAFLENISVSIAVDKVVNYFACFLAFLDTKAYEGLRMEEIRVYFEHTCGETVFAINNIPELGFSSVFTFFLQNLLNFGLVCKLLAQEEVFVAWPYRLAYQIYTPLYDKQAEQIASEQAVNAFTVLHTSTAPSEKGENTEETLKELPLSEDDFEYEGEDDGVELEDGDADEDALYASLELTKNQQSPISETIRTSVDANTDMEDYLNGSHTDEAPELIKDVDFLSKRSILSFDSHRACPVAPWSRFNGEFNFFVISRMLKRLLSFIQMFPGISFSYLRENFQVQMMDAALLALIETLVDMGAIQARAYQKQQHTTLKSTIEDALIIEIPRSSLHSYPNPGRGNHASAKSDPCCFASVIHPDTGSRYQAYFPSTNCMTILIEYTRSLEPT